MRDYVWIRRLRDGKMLDIPKDDLAMTLKRGGFEVITHVSAEQLSEAPVVKSVFDPTKCILCGFKGETSEALKNHKQEKHS